MSFLKDFLFFHPENPLIFNNPHFWIFFALVLLAYQFVYGIIPLRNTYLLIVSLFFYYKSGGWFIGILLFSTLVDYYCAIQIQNSKRKSGKKFFLYLSLFANLGLLFYYKYTYFLADILQDFFHTDIQRMDYLAYFSNQLLGTHWDFGKIILPVGISFYTFQTMSYSIDVYRGRLKPVRNFLDFAFYVSFFPQLVAGPIVRASEFIPQIYQPYHLDNAKYGRAIFLIMNGLIKKILIADFISISFVDKVFENPGLYTGFANLMAMYGYAIQIYCDFSGYTDIAIGVALLLGFELNMNFNSPYKAYNLSDFWRRWHISLSSWLRDYLYISLGGNRKGTFFTYRNLMITMVLGGLWHGASFRFVIWGFLHGAGLVLSRLWKDEETGENSLGKLVGWLFTFHFVCFCWLFFRAKDLWTVQEMILQIFTNFDFESISNVIEVYKEVFFLILLAYIIHFFPKGLKEDIQETFISTPEYIKVVVLVLVIIGLYQAHNSDLQPFIYFQF